MALDSSGPDQSIIRGRGGVVWRLRRLLVVHGSSLIAAQLVITVLGDVLV